MKNQLKIDLYLLKIDYEINFVMEQTSVIAEKMSFFKDTYCKVESREVHLRISRLEDWKLWQSHLAHLNFVLILYCTVKKVLIHIRILKYALTD